MNMKYVSDELVSVNGKSFPGFTPEGYNTLMEILSELKLMTIDKQEFTFNSSIGSITFKI